MKIVLFNLYHFYFTLLSFHLGVAPPNLYSFNDEKQKSFNLRYLKNAGETNILQSAINCDCSRYNDSLELVDFFYAMNGNESWDTVSINVAGTVKRTPWNLHSSMEQWAGIKLNANGCVEEIDFRISETLNDVIKRGHIPDLKLPALKKLELGDDKSPYFPILDSIQAFSCMPSLERLSFQNCGIKGNLPTFQNTNKLRYIFLSGNNFSGNLPAYENLTDLEEIFIQNNLLSGEIPYNFPINKKNLSIVIFSNSVGNRNSFSGTLPDFSNLTKLTRLDIRRNCIDSLPPMTNLLALGKHDWSGFIVRECKLTFDDILNNYCHLVDNCQDDSLKSFSRYSGQDVIKIPTLPTVPKCGSVRIDLEVDEGVEDNKYTWLRKIGNTFSDTITTLIGQNYIDLKNIQNGNIYKCIISNPRVPGLILATEEITILLEPNTCNCPLIEPKIEAVDSTICTGSLGQLKIYPNSPTFSYSFTIDGFPQETSLRGTGDTLFMVTNPILENISVGLDYWEEDNLGCDIIYSSTPIEIKTLPLSFLITDSFEESKTGNMDGSINLSIDQCSSPIEINWEPKRGSISPTPGNCPANYIITGLTSESYLIKVEDLTSGCKIDTMVVLGQPPKCKVITNNGDEQHQYLVFKNLENNPVENKLTVFNRFGEVVFQCENYNRNKWWDGYFDGKLLPDDTYWFNLELKNQADLSGCILILSQEY